MIFLDTLKQMLCADISDTPAEFLEPINTLVLLKNKSGLMTSLAMDRKRIFSIAHTSVLEFTTAITKKILASHAIVLPKLRQLLLQLRFLLVRPTHALTVTTKVSASSPSLTSPAKVTPEKPPPAPWSVLKRFTSPIFQSIPAIC